MHSFLDAKIMAKLLRAALAQRTITISHSDSLELVARQFGFDNWNILAARIEAAREAPPPHKWSRHHEGGGIYHLSVEPAEPLVLSLQSRPGEVASAADFGTLMQTNDATPYRGAALAFTAELAGEDVDTASVWMRVDDKDGKVLAFDNLFRTQGATLSGTFGWTRLRVELPVADAAVKVSYGAILKGLGRLKVRSPRLAPVAWESVAA
jgi:hypothetical protein